MLIRDKVPFADRESYNAAKRLRDLTSRYYSPTAAKYHYRHMAEGNFREYLKGNIVWRKKYFYVLRPILAIKWIEAGLGIVPTEFEQLVNKTVPPGDLMKAIDALLEEKAAGAELDRGPGIPEKSAFLSSELNRLDGVRFDRDPNMKPCGPLNELFRQELKAVWSAIETPIDKDEALEIARRLETPTKEAFGVYDSKPDNWRLYVDSKEDCWFVSCPSKAENVIQSTRVCVISKMTGKVVFHGSAGYEG